MYVQNSPSGLLIRIRRKKPPKFLMQRYKKNPMWREHIGELESWRYSNVKLERIFQNEWNILEAI